MGNFTGVTREGRGGYTIWVNGDPMTTAKNPTEAAAKLDKELNRHAMNATREAETATWNAQRAKREYSFAERAGMAA